MNEMSVLGSGTGVLGEACCGVDNCPELTVTELKVASVIKLLVPGLATANQAIAETSRKPLSIEAEGMGEHSRPETQLYRKCGISSKYKRRP